MPISKQSIQRICALYSILRTSTYPYYPTKEQIIEKLNDQLNVKMCASSIEKDMYRLRSDFGLTIRYHNTIKGYYIPNADESTDKEFVTNLLIYLSLQDIPIISDVLENLLE